MSQWKVILAALIIFGSGVITGGLLVKNTQPTKSASIHRGNVNAPAPWQLQRAEFYRRIEKELNLTPEQKQSVDKIFKDSQERTKPLWEKISPQLRSEVDRVHDEVREQLTPEQRPKFDELLKTKSRKNEKPEEKRHRKKEGTNNPPAVPAPAAP